MALRDYWGSAVGMFANRYNPEYGRRLIGNVVNRYKQGGLGAALTPQRAYAAPSSQVAGASVAGLSYKKKADGGYDYFVNGQAASLQDYWAAGGQIPADEPTLQGQSAPISSGYGAGGGATGGGYNRQAAQEEYDRQVRAINRAYENGLISFEDKQREIEQSRKNLGKKARETLASQTGFFQSIAPNAYMSQQENYAQKVRESQAEGLSNLNLAEQRLGQRRAQHVEEYQDLLGSLKNAYRETPVNFASGLVNYASQFKQPQTEGLYAADPQEILKAIQGMSLSNTVAPQSATPGITTTTPQQPAGLQGYLYPQLTEEEKRAYGLI